MICSGILSESLVERVGFVVEANLAEREDAVVAASSAVARAEGVVGQVAVVAANSAVARAEGVVAVVLVVELAAAVQ